MNVTRRQIRLAREAYLSQIAFSGKTTDLEMMLFDALDGLVRGHVIESDIERALAAKLQRVESMLEELVEHARKDGGADWTVLEIMAVERDDDGKIESLAIARTIFEEVESRHERDLWRPFSTSTRKVGRVNE